MMSDIDKVMSWLEGLTWEDLDEYHSDSEVMTTAKAALEILKGRKGKWERHYSRPNVYADLFWWCSCCEEPTRYNDAGIFYQYCPHCGAKLDPCIEGTEE